MERTIYTERNSTVTFDKDSIETIGKQLMEGMLTTIGKWFVIGLVVVAIIGAVSEGMQWGFDGTDDKEHGKRSGITLRTDHGTGCQYLETSDGGITPRLTPEGKHYCN